jgi:hypothetical protein
MELGRSRKKDGRNLLLTIELPDKQMDPMQG